ncbi:hypothetical protein RQM65_15310 [Pricia sp. S334]|uniref:Uncharacterized protein n=1 Tax=Pricia mediterranea TaxID=3076079 RepID=A0ABU3L8G4_9FLAO|nr:hypothetical protein [Pricia sp. S334]MDT7830035.1 hypothetical protein [Pricia sp. S334]
MSGLILIQSFDIAMEDIVQFDELLEHAEFHAEEYGDNIFVFISKHYGELKEQHNKDHQEEKKDHEKLPFQNHCSCSSTVAIVSDKYVVSLTSFPNLDGETNFYYPALISSLHAIGRFQPPRSA